MEITCNQLGNILIAAFRLFDENEMRIYRGEELNLNEDEGLGTDYGSEEDLRHRLNYFEISEVRDLRTQIEDLSNNEKSDLLALYWFGADPDSYENNIDNAVIQAREIVENTPSINDYIEEKFPQAFFNINRAITQLDLFE